MGEGGQEGGKPLRLFLKLIPLTGTRYTGEVPRNRGEHFRRRAGGENRLSRPRCAEYGMYEQIFFFSSLSSGGWGKIKL